MGVADLGGVDLGAVSRETRSAGAPYPRRAWWE